MRLFSLCAVLALAVAALWIGGRPWAEANRSGTGGLAQHEGSAALSYTLAHTLSDPAPFGTAGSRFGL